MALITQPLAIFLLLLAAVRSVLFVSRKAQIPSPCLGGVWATESLPQQSVSVAFFRLLFAGKIFGQTSVTWGHGIR